MKATIELPDADAAVAAGRSRMHGGIMRPGAASIVIGAALLLGTPPVAAAPHLPSATAPALESAQETAPKSTFSIFGLVETPGRYDWSAGMTVGRALAAAGGYADGGSPDELQIQRMIEGRLVARAVTEDEAVQPDDVIMVRGRAVERPEPEPGWAYANAQSYYRRDGWAVRPADRRLAARRRITGRPAAGRRARRR